MNTIDEHIHKDLSEIEAARASGDMAKVRHLEQELAGLKEYKEHHPEDSHDPSPLEVYCDMNPDAPECRVYDD
ncbi:MAG: CP12 domain-containing protein [Cyanobacteriota bacterium]|nr:CP12 domain-containing protein [Cyanobacteriota bacterium]